MYLMQITLIKKSIGTKMEVMEAMGVMVGILGLAVRYPRNLEIL